MMYIPIETAPNIFWQTRKALEMGNKDNQRFSIIFIAGDF